MDMKFAEAARQLRQPEGEGGVKMGEQMNKSNRLIYEMTLNFLQMKREDAILEIGMGNGHFVRELIEKEPSVHYTGIDLSDVMVEAARRENEGITFHCATAEKMPVEDAGFNKVFGVNVLYFWDQPAVTLKEIARVLKPEGELILAIRSKATMQLLPFIDNGFTLYDIETATKLLQENGFRVTEVISAIEPEKLAADGSRLVQLENICIRGVKI
ncbi:methyltransferase domain-containing protein [Chitinophaga oryziterrae]|uniref:Methyltransferase domain-containing protein n=1 Tax=Chitinophaga oryziterrae TaxID=1031224 RepID=A0A6N8J3Z5_9BACT|nr:class I SAM-dependent methyltransferase [Chitinophaga oryziterrae]MVT39421.1 methyltransferase domain-containing protein [Chitinophaga oryziterrae]